MSKISREYASTAKVVATDTTHALVLAAPAYLVGFSAVRSTASASIRFTDSVGGTRRWEHTLGIATVEGTGTDTVMFPFPIQFTKGISLSITGLEKSVSVAYIPE